ncbi:MAG: hypothetical protein ACXIVL_08050 [Oceanicaulis sp.]
MKLFKHTALAAAIALSTSACANLMTVYRAPDLTGRTSAEVRQAPARSLVLDANQHVLLQGTPRIADETTYNIFCAQPSPDAITAVATSGGLNAAFRDTSAETAYALGQSSASIGLRTQSIQLLRDHGYRLCEGYLSGAIDDFNFRILQRRYQNLMTAVLAIEQLTGAVSAQQAVVGAQGGATAGDNIESLVQRRIQYAARITDDERELARQEAIASDDDASDSAKRDANSAISRLRDSIETHRSGRDAIDTLLRNLDASSASTTVVQNLGALRQAAALSPSGIQPIAEAVTAITRQVTSANHLVSMCFDYLMYRAPDVEFNSETWKALQGSCQDSISNVNRMNENRRDLIQSLSISLRENTAPMTVEQINAWARLISIAGESADSVQMAPDGSSGGTALAGAPSQG